MAFLMPLDLAAGCREQSTTINAKMHATLLKHFEAEECDSFMIKSMKKAALEELLIMEAVVCINDCKEIVAFLNRSSLKTRLCSTVKQEVETRWNSHRDLLVSLDNEWDKVRSRHEN